MMGTVKYRALAGLSLSCLLAAPLACPAAAQGPAAVEAPMPSFDAKAQADVVDTAAKALTDRYVYPEKATAAVALIRDNLQKGRYAGLQKGDFAKRLTRFAERHP